MNRTIPGKSSLSETTVRWRPLSQGETALRRSVSLATGVRIRSICSLSFPVNFLLWSRLPSDRSVKLIGELIIKKKKKKENEELSLSSIDTVFPSDWGTYGDLACHQDAFFISIIHLLSHLVLWDMFKNTFQSGFLSILYSIGSKPLQIWDKKVGYDAERSKLKMIVCSSSSSGTQRTYQTNHR